MLLRLLSLLVTTAGSVADGLRALHVHDGRQRESEHSSLIPQPPLSLLLATPAVTAADYCLLCS